VKGQSYTIATVGTTDFTAIGASANTVGTTFVATGVGTGTGTATCYIQTLYPSDPIDLNYGAIGTILWMSQGFGLFIGTTVGVYQITSGLGPGFSPLSGGFLPNSLGNFFTMPVTWTGSRARNQCVTMTQESVVFVCSVDTVACLNRKTRQINKMKLDVPLTHAIDSMAWLGGPHVAILLADIAARNSWGATGYNAANNIVLIVNEQTGTVSRFTGLNAFTIAGVGGYGLVFKASDGTTIKVGAIPYLALERYASSPAVFDPSTFYDYSGNAYQMRILTLPLNVGKDIGDPRHPVRVRVRVHNSWSFSVRQNGQTLTTWTAADPGYGLSLPNLYTGDVELTLTSGYQAFTQIEITDNSSYPLEILAVQVDLTIQSSVEDGA
jgi:hypothetical protein